MSGLKTNALDTIGENFVTNDQTTVPTEAEFDALSTGLTTMEVRRRIHLAFPSAMEVALHYAANVSNAGPSAPDISAQTVAEGGSLNFQHAEFTHGDSKTVTYGATLQNGDALPGWITYNTETRTFTGTAPAVDADEDILVRVNGADPFSKVDVADFTLTVTAA